MPDVRTCRSQFIVHAIGTRTRQGDDIPISKADVQVDNGRNRRLDHSPGPALWLIYGYVMPLRNAAIAACGGGTQILQLAIICKTVGTMVPAYQETHYIKLVLSNGLHGLDTGTVLGEPGHAEERTRKAKTAHTI